MINNTNLIHSYKSLIVDSSQACKDKLSGCHSVVNKKVSEAIKGTIMSVKQGVASSAAYTAGSMVAAPISSKVGREFGCVLGAGLALGMTALFANFYFKAHLDVNKGMELALLILTFVVITTIINSQQNSINQVTQELGEIVGSTAAGITCSYVALKALGGTEVFWDPNKIGRSYPLKCLSSMIGMSVIYQLFYKPDSDINGYLFDMVVGSMLFSLPEFLSTLCPQKSS